MSSGFVTETEILEARQRRQEEWEKVRTADQPLERPEEPFDGRSLYDRLKEQRTKKDLEYEETHKLKNLIRGLDDDEVQFLDIVDQNKMDLEKKKMLEEERELKDFRNRVTSLQEESADKKLQNELKTKCKSTQPSNARPSQKSLLGIGIKRKNCEMKKSLTDDNKDKQRKMAEQKDIKELPSIKSDNLDKGHFKCVAILPGLGPYNESSDSEISTGSEDEPDGCDDRIKYDLLGNKREKKQHNHQGE